LDSNGMEEIDIPTIDEELELAAWLGNVQNEGSLVRTRLKADDRVIARVTDGIYREPASAFRELVSNAWDADATEVTILTDAPRFSRIYVRDNGNGMSYQAVARLLHQIGGSAKRRSDGAAFGITGDDPDKSRGGRPLIGKIGIGLFSVSQLSRRFRIITKSKNECYRITAEVRLRAYSEDGSDDLAREDDDRFISGEVKITREHTDDLLAHGTDIILEEIKPRVRDVLRSTERWRAIAGKAAAEASGDLETYANTRVVEPIYHVGWIDKIGDSANSPTMLSKPPNLPWTAEDPPSSRIATLMDAIEQQSSRISRPDLKTTFDSYLETLWRLALSIPVKYVDKHPFDLTASDDIDVFWISNSARGQAQAVKLRADQTVRSAVREQVAEAPELLDGLADPIGSFQVVFDGVELKRPVRFKYFQTERRGLQKSLLLVGKYTPDLSNVDTWLRGGELSLESYLFWTGRIVPKENNGVLTRIRGTSGALYDPTFFNYPILELTRLKQISSEIFVRQGLDAALNIDRESFNFAHPHVQLVTTWLHRALRQLTNKHKELSAKLREQRREEDAAEKIGSITAFAKSVWQDVRAEPAPDVVIAIDESAARDARRTGVLALNRSALRSLATTSNIAEREEREEKARAVLSILAAFNVLEDLSFDDQQRLVDSITRVFYPQRNG